MKYRLSINLSTKKDKTVPNKLMKTVPVSREGATQALTCALLREARTISWKNKKVKARIGS